MIHLFTVADCFQIEGRGCVLVPGIPTEPGSPILLARARIRLRTPSGQVKDTYVNGYEMVNFRKKPEKICIPISLPNDIAKEDVPVGTEVLLLEEKFEIVKDTRH